MSIGVIIAIAIIVILLLWIIAIYNMFKRLKVIITEAWSGIDVQLKRKANIIPNLVDTLKMQMNFEEKLLTELTAARSGLSSNDRETAMSANDQLDQVFAGLRATMEAYPTLGTNASFRKMMDEIRDCEDKIAYSRNRYNMSVAKYNMEIAVFPNSIFANMFNAHKEKMFELSVPPREIVDNIRISKL